MKMLLRLGIWLAVTATVALAESKSPPPSLTFEQLIFDKADFIKRLPEKTLIWSDPTTSPQSPQTFAVVEGALKEFGDVPGVEFVRVPASVSLPILARWVQPVYPEKMGREGKAGEAKFLVLINSAGGIGAIYCLQATNNDFAVAGAQAVVQWKFQPAVWGKTKVSILTVLPVRFTVEK